MSELTLQQLEIEIRQCLQVKPVAPGIGALMAQAKALCGHGAWEPWVKAKLGITSRTARNYMRAAKSESSIVSNRKVKSEADLKSETKSERAFVSNRNRRRNHIDDADDTVPFLSPLSAEEQSDRDRLEALIRSSQATIVKQKATIVKEKVEIKMIEARLNAAKSKPAKVRPAPAATTGQQASLPFG